MAAQNLVFTDRASIVLSSSIKTVILEPLPYDERWQHKHSPTSFSLLSPSCHFYSSHSLVHLGQLPLDCTQRQTTR